MARFLARCGVLLAAVVFGFLAVSQPAFAGAKPPDPIPEELSRGGVPVGINTKTGEYCAYDTDINCRPPRDCELPGTVCIGEGSSDPKEARRYEETQLERWLEKADTNAPNFPKIKKYVTNCVKKDKKPFQQCSQEAGWKWPGDAYTPLDWVGDKIKEWAGGALEKAAGALGTSVVWLIEQFAGAFNSISTIKLADTGIGPVMGIMTGISILVATFLLLIQFAKLGISQKGAPLVTAITGLAKWGVILAVYVTATQTALDWSDTFSTAMINYTLTGEGGESVSGAELADTKTATEAMKQQLGTMFAGLVSGSGAATAGAALITGSGVAPAATGFVIVISILAIVAVGALWLEMLVRQAAIMILVTVMPIALAGQMSDATSEWWPKARNALISLILAKPVIVLCFSIGASAMGNAKGIRNVFVGLIVFILACFAWPALAKFMTFTTAGAGSSGASGMLSTIGSSVSSAFGGHNPALGGAGMVGGGSGFTRALEADNAAGGADGGGSSGGSGGGQGFWSKAMMGRKSGSFMSKVGGTVGMGLQVAAAGKDMLEGAAGNMAAHAGLDHAHQGGRHVVIPRRGGGGDDGGGSGGGGDGGGSGGAGGGSAPAPAPPVQPDIPEAEPPPISPGPPPPAQPPEGS
ncbi:hypothetical protein KBZ21_15745 [Streptomyces sp. A73]|uniref:hypothetical protein n=1 Tax=Streptomyces sp. RK75 TaxID=2824895 RepID=UPI001B36DAFB|nr:hypothetical protein [Streptomyces sp. RK75]MBQ0867455.1 hypothetical protein [Streptomyces sp. RK75]MBQ1159544.1 hypothetical protein [Streptomyces sp. A73]